MAGFGGFQRVKAEGAERVRDGFRQVGGGLDKVPAPGAVAHFPRVRVVIGACPFGVHARPVRPQNKVRHGIPSGERLL